MTDHPPEIRRLDEILARTHITLKRRLMELLRECNITPSQFRVLVLLKRNGEYRMKDLVAKLHKRPSTASGIVDRMVKKDLVERFPDADDRRVVNVRLTASGSALMEELRERSLHRLKREVAVLSSEEVQLLIELLERLCANITFSTH